MKWNSLFTLRTEKKIYVDALVTDLYLPIDNQAVEIAVKNLQNLPLTDSNVSNSPFSIDILIGCKDYWRFIGSKQVKGWNQTRLYLSRPIKTFGGKKTQKKEWLGVVE